MTLHQALRQLNDAAYATLKAGRDAKLYPHLDRAALRSIISQTDALVDENTPEREAAQ
jgi:hypothetical protein